MNYNGSNRLAQIPQHVAPTGIVMRQCTYEYKILPVIETVRKIHNLKKHKRMKPTEMWLGISTDEIERLKQSKLYNIDYFYPLLYHGISRSDCIKFFNDHIFFLAYSGRTDSNLMFIIKQLITNITFYDNLEKIHTVILIIFKIKPSLLCS